MEQMVFPVTKKEAQKNGLQYSSTQNREARFPSRLRELRREAGISQDALAKIIGCSKSTLGQYENGDTLPDAKTLEAMAVFFMVSADYLLCSSDVKTPNLQAKKVCEQTGLSEKALMHLCAYSSVNAIDGLNMLLEDLGFIPLFNRLSTLKEHAALANKYEHDTPYMLEDMLGNNNDPSCGIVVFGYDACRPQLQELSADFSDRIEEITGLKELKDYTKKKRSDGLVNFLEQRKRNTTIEP